MYVMCCGGLMIMCMYMCRACVVLIVVFGGVFVLFDV